MSYLLTKRNFLLLSLLLMLHLKQTFCDTVNIRVLADGTRDTREMQCVAKGGSLTIDSIKWFKNNQLINTPNDKYEVDGDSLTVNNVVEGDGGTYNCTHDGGMTGMDEYNLILLGYQILIEGNSTVSVLRNSNYSHSVLFRNTTFSDEICAITTIALSGDGIETLVCTKGDTAKCEVMDVFPNVTVNIKNLTDSVNVTILAVGSVSECNYQLMHTFQISVMPVPSSTESSMTLVMSTSDQMPGGRSSSSSTISMVLNVTSVIPITSQSLITSVVASSISSEVSAIITLPVGKGTTRDNVAVIASSTILVLLFVLAVMISVVIVIIVVNRHKYRTGHHSTNYTSCHLPEPSMISELPKIDGGNIHLDDKSNSKPRPI